MAQFLAAIIISFLMSDYRRDTEEWSIWALNGHSPQIERRSALCRP
jgi:hypothetical protein